MIYKELTTKIILNNKPLEVKLTVKVEEDFEPVENTYDFGDNQLNEEYLNRFKDRDLFNGCITVTARALGESGFYHLGCCHISYNNTFNSEPFEKDVEMYLKEYDMFQNAIDDLRQRLVERHNELRQFFIESR